jgi:hypothetical protein
LGAALTLPIAASSADEFVPATAPEESVLVATRELPPSDTSSRNSQSGGEQDDLQPIAESSDRAPELAQSTEKNGSRLRFEAGLSESDEAATSQSDKVIRRTPAVEQNVSSEPVKFQGITVGQTNKQQVLDLWGKPAETVDTAEGPVFVFDMDPFQAVEVLIGNDELVSAIKVALAAPLDPKYLSEQLSLNDIRPVTATDEAGQPLGMAFPERGVIFMFQASESDALAAGGDMPPCVSHVVMQRLDPLAFTMRAENNLHGPYTKNIDDLRSAIELDPQCAEAHYLLAQIYLATGQADVADSSARAACEADSENARYQLIHARTQELLGEYDNAVLTVRAVLDRENVSEIDRAQALYQMGSLASLGDVEIASKAIGFQTRAIEIADKLSTSTIVKDRRAAKQILVEAHMAVAEEIARQSYNKKVENLQLWIGRASGIAEEYIANDGGGVELRLMIAQRALSALASFRPTLDPAPWVTEAQESADVLFAQCDDEMWQARIKWELGVAYLNSLKVEHVRRETQTALKYGDCAVEFLAEGAATRQAVHTSEQLIGQLYFQMGAVHAVHQLDHVKAAQWYDKAEKLLMAKRPPSQLYAPRREGEMLVSIGVSYWQIGEQQRALELTQKGVNLVEDAVAAGILARSTLTVPYGNLATMYEKVGETNNAAKYANLARRAGGKTETAPERVGQANNVRQTSGAAGSNAQRQRSDASVR